MTADPFDRIEKALFFLQVARASLEKAKKRNHEAIQDVELLTLFGEIQLAIWAAEDRLYGEVDYAGRA